MIDINHLQCNKVDQGFKQITLHNEQRCNVAATDGSVDSDLPPDTVGYADGETASLTAQRFGPTFMNLIIGNVNTT